MSECKRLSKRFKGSDESNSYPIISDEIKLSRRPYCSDWGPDREKNFPEYHFCSHCKSFDEAVKLKPSLEKNRNSKMFKCELNHTNWDVPYMKKKYHYVMMRDIDIDSEKKTIASTIVSTKTSTPSSKKGIASYLDELFQK